MVEQAGVLDLAQFDPEFEQSPFDIVVRADPGPHIVFVAAVEFENKVGIGLSIEGLENQLEVFALLADRHQHRH